MLNVYLITENAGEMHPLIRHKNGVSAGNYLIAFYTALDVGHLDYSKGKTVAPYITSLIRHFGPEKLQIIDFLWNETLTEAQTFVSLATTMKTYVQKYSQELEPDFDVEALEEELISLNQTAEDLVDSGVKQIDLITL